MEKINAAAPPPVLAGLQVFRLKGETREDWKQSGKVTDEHVLQL